MTALWVTTIVVGVLSVPFVIIWWRIGDRWADSEHKRFQPKREPPRPNTDDAVVIPNPEPDPQQDRREA